MNITITKRALITHTLRWYWKNSQLRKAIREVSENGMTHATAKTTRLPGLDRDTLIALISADPEALPAQVLAEYTVDELLELYRVVFMDDEEHQLGITMSPLTDKVGKHILPYVGVMVVFCLADILMKSAYGNNLTEEQLEGLTGLRWLAARRLHNFTKRLTRINADNNPTYGVRVEQNIAEVYLTKDGVPGDTEIALAVRTYPGNIPTVWRELSVRPTRFVWNQQEVSLLGKSDAA